MMMRCVVAHNLAGALPTSEFVLEKNGEKGAKKHDLGPSMRVPTDAHRLAAAMKVWS